MKDFKGFFILLLTILLLITLCSCSTSQRTEESENSYRTEEYEKKFEYDIDTTEDGKQSENIGSDVEQTGDSIEPIIGQWKLIEGLPEGMDDYELIIAPDGVCTQVITIDGSSTSTLAKVVASSNGFDVIDDTGTRLLNLQISGQDLVTNGLINDTSIFRKDETTK